MIMKFLMFIHPAVNSDSPLTWLLLLIQVTTALRCNATIRLQFTLLMFGVYIALLNRCSISSEPRRDPAAATHEGAI